MTIANTSAANIGNQSIDVTVGEVDEANYDDEKQGTQAPNTGLFGLDADTSTSSFIVCFIISAAFIFICLSIRCRRKRRERAISKR